MLQGARGVTGPRVTLSNWRSCAMPEGAEDSRSCRAARDGPRGVPDPLAPRAFIKARAANSGGLEREQSLAGRHARAAHADRSLAGFRAGACAPELRERGRFAEPAAVIDVLEERQVDGLGT